MVPLKEGDVTLGDRVTSTPSSAFADTSLIKEAWSPSRGDVTLVTGELQNIPASAPLSVSSFSRLLLMVVFVFLFARYICKNIVAYPLVEQVRLFFGFQISLTFSELHL